MTLRAHYAGEFMGAMITTLTAPETVSNWKFMAREACAAADALIAELAKGAGE